MPAAIAIPAIATVVAGGAAAGAAVYGSRRAGRSSDLASRYQSDTANRAAEIEAAAAREQLEFLRQQEAQRQREWQLTQDRNRQLYETERGVEESRYTDLQSRLQPYRQFGAGAIGQLGRPFGAGTLGARMGG